MTTPTPAVTPPTSAEVQAIVDRAIDRYIAARHDKVAAFVDGNYSLIASVRLHRKALGLDLVRAPANVALALPYLASQLAAAGLDVGGADRLADRIRRWKILLDTDVARELTWRLHT